MSDTELDLVETDRLISALDRRHDTSIFLGTRRCGDGSSDDTLSYKGSAASIVLLCNRLSHIVVEEIERESRGGHREDR